MYKKLRALLIGFLVLLIGLKYYLHFKYNYPIGSSSVLVLISLIFIFSWREKVAWFFGIILFLYGIYNIFFISFWAAEPTTMEFTYPLVLFLYGSRTGSIGDILLVNIPRYFYLVTLVIFLTKIVRRFYGVTFEYGKSRKDTLT